VKEVRLHGRGGQGTVKASEIIVYAAVQENMYATAVPYFGFERSGAPVSAFVRIDDDVIWPKTQVYNPDCVVVLDPTVRRAVPLFEGVKDGACLVINCDEELVAEFDLPEEIADVGWVDATKISLDELGRNVPNTTMLGAFARVAGWLGWEQLARRSADIFGEPNYTAVKRGYEEVQILNHRIRR